jgi:hypothetical protein
MAGHASLASLSDTVTLVKATPEKEIFQLLIGRNRGQIDRSTMLFDHGNRENALLEQHSVDFRGAIV